MGTARDQKNRWHKYTGPCGIFRPETVHIWYSEYLGMLVAIYEIYIPVIFSVQETAGDSSVRIR
jgi:hypothetical protein